VSRGRRVSERVRQDRDGVETDSDERFSAGIAELAMATAQAARISQVRLKGPFPWLRPCKSWGNLEGWLKALWHQREARGEEAKSQGCWSPSVSGQEMGGGTGLEETLQRIWDSRSSRSVITKARASTQAFTFVNSPMI